MAANKYIQAGLPSDLFSKFEVMRAGEERTIAKMAEILIREAIASRLMKRREVGEG
jgi:hypothetical protein